MPSTAEKMLFRFRDSDSRLGVSRGTLRQLAGQLGVDETMAIHMALAEMRDRNLPRYERDDGPLTPAQLKQARSLVNQARQPTSSLFGTSARMRKKAKA